MSSSQENNKRIAKNTIVLYCRMLFMMAISLYTSRVVLNTLGVVDFGIFSVVGTVVSMFSFLNGAMTSSTTRYITFALGQGDEKRLKTIFSTALQIHALIAFVIVVLSETIGLWFFYHKMQIPPDRLDAAFWVLQLCIVDSVFAVMSVPYNAAIVAHERMSAFAWMSIYDAVAKLLIVYLLVVTPFDRLVFYAAMLVVVQITSRFIYSIYCNHHFAESKYNRVWDKPLFREMLSFASWSLFGDLSMTLFTAGLNMLLNVFFGPIVNAARGVATQVQGTIMGFVNNFQMAVNPQITKTYAKGEMDAMHNLMFRCARFSFYLLFFISLPVILEADFVLTVWLKTVPENTVTFLRIIICTSLIYTCANPLIIANKATGKVKRYQTVCGTILLLILPVSYVVLKLGAPAYAVFIVHFVMECICQLARMVMLRPLIGLRVRDYFRSIYLYIFAVVAISALAPVGIFVAMPDGVLRFFTVCVVSVVSVSSVVYVIGLTAGEKVFVREKVRMAFARLTAK